MKLRNKKTGEIGDIAQTSADCIIVYYPIIDGIAINPQKRAIYTSLDQLNAEWEDYEEPKERWYIDAYGTVCKKDNPTLKDGFDNEPLITFETEEEAEKAVEKLKAWTRLRNKGFKFNGWYGGSKVISYEITSLENETYIPRQICDDLDLLFGGEE